MNLEMLNVESAIFCKLMISESKIEFVNVQSVIVCDQLFEEIVTLVLRKLHFLNVTVNPF